MRDVIANYDEFVAFLLFKDYTYNRILILNDREVKVMYRVGFVEDNTVEASRLKKYFDQYEKECGYIFSLSE